MMKKEEIYLSVIRNIILLLIFIFSLSLEGCISKENEDKKPNILWIFLEDTSPLLACYGDSLVSTPNIDKLAQSGTVFRNAIMPAPVCSASRSSIITGMMSTTLGIQNHHSSRSEAAAIHLPDSIKTLPELFKEAGYFTFNNGKDDYNFVYNREDLYDQDYSYHPLYGKSGVRLALSSIKEKEPFFGQIQLYGGKEIFSSSFKEKVSNPVDRITVELPPYLPEHPVIIEEYTQHLDAIQLTDEKVGEIIGQLDKAGLLDNTIVFFFSDHGMRLTRHKQFLYEGGIHVPLIISDFRKANKSNNDTFYTDLVSGIDLGPSSLGLAGLPIPSFMEGVNIFDEENEKRTYVISTRDRCDFTIDRIRSVRSAEYKYIRNFMTDRAYSQKTYMDVDGVDFVKVMKQLNEEGNLNKDQARFMSAERPGEELYKLEDDPYELNNLASDPDYSDILQKHAMILDNWIAETNDQGQYPENEEDLKLMLGIWGKHALNPEYAPLREKYPKLEGSLWDYKNSEWKSVTN